MKKILLFTLLFFVSVSVAAQTNQKMNFMGVPMGIHVNEFKDKLIAKGISYDKETSRILPEGVKLFRGRYAGYSSQIYTYFNTSNKKVYHVKVKIHAVSSVAKLFGDEERRDDIIKDIKDLLLRKYPNAKFIDPNRFLLEKEDYLYRFDLSNGSIEIDYEDAYTQGGTPVAPMTIRDGYNVIVDYWHLKSYDENRNRYLDDV